LSISAVSFFISYSCKELSRSDRASESRSRSCEGDAKGATKEKNSGERTKEDRTRRTIDGTAGSVRRQTVGRERQHTETKEESVKVGHKCLPLMRPDAGVYIRESGTVRHKYSTTRKSELKRGKNRETNAEAVLPTTHPHSER
jgi:hypothetical protein